MQAHTPTYHSKIYRDFMEIEVAAYHAVIAFYDNHRRRLHDLSFSEHFELLVAYLNALFETGDYYKFLHEVQPAIEATIIQNIKIYKGEDLYTKLLFRKAAAHYHAMEYTESEYILRELLKLSPTNDVFARLLKKCLQKRQQAIVQYTRAISILLFILSATLICIELLIIRPYVKDKVATFEISRNITFVLGCLLLSGGEMFHHWHNTRQVRQFIKKAIAKRHQRHK